MALLETLSTVTKSTDNMATVHLLMCLDVPNICCVCSRLQNLESSTCYESFVILQRQKANKRKLSIAR
jgi:hypothetical protein